MKNVLKKFGNVKENVDLTNYNTYHAKSVVKYLIEVSSVLELKELIAFLKGKKINFFIIGNGSNIIFFDDFYDGVFIKLSGLNKLDIKDDLVYVESAVMLPSLVNSVIDSNLSGLEFASGIPGTIGGSVYNNAGAYNSSIFDYVESVTVLDQDLNIKELLKKDISYGYRTTYFKENPGFIILSCVLKLEKGSKEESIKIIEDRRRRRLESQPLDRFSAGSVFRNPENNFAGKLIEDLNLKGFSVGNATVSEKHANFIVTSTGVKGKDIKELIDYIKLKVEEKYGIKLILEQEIIDWKG